MPASPNSKFRLSAIFPFLIIVVVLFSVGLSSFFLLSNTSVLGETTATTPQNSHLNPFVNSAGNFASGAITANETNPFRQHFANPFVNSFHTLFGNFTEALFIEQKETGNPATVTNITFGFQVLGQVVNASNSLSLTVVYLNERGIVNGQQLSESIFVYYNSSWAPLVVTAGTSNSTGAEALSELGNLTSNYSLMFAYENATLFQDATRNLVFINSSSETFGAVTMNVTMFSDLQMRDESPGTEFAGTTFSIGQLPDTYFAMITNLSTGKSPGVGGVNFQLISATRYG